MAGSGVDDDHGWTERLAWAYGLIAPTPAERAAALERLTSAQGEVESALLRIKKAWLPTPRLRFKARDRAAAQKAYDEAASRCLPEALCGRPASGEINTWAGLPFALLFLEWEARYPQEWTQHAKAWGTKQYLIRQLATADHDDQVRTKLVDLVDLAVQRPYRCKDREYVRVARAIDGDELRGRLHRAHDSGNSWAQLHAGHVLWLLDHPEVPNTRHVWRTRLAATRTS
ncbi:hypothetical protein ABZ725_09590 [Streptomyces sp. NPDC006872]|uniref:hypothetical protein n=1 Tax=Streptomyces sp. NPDC006872 TaxID=3155720 RepID=UPI0033C45EC6